MSIAAVAVVKSRNGNGTRGSLVDGSLLKKWSEGEVERDGARDFTRRDEERAPWERGGVESRDGSIHERARGRSERRA